MISWSAIGAELRSVFSEIAIVRNATGGDASGSSGFSAEWIDGRKPWADGKRFSISDHRGYAVGLTVTSVAGIGHDETRESLDDDGNVVETQTGQRKFTLQVQALAIANGVNEDWAIAITERIRTRIRSRRIIDRLLDSDVAVIDCGPSIFVSGRDGQRMLTSSTLDIVFGCTASEDDPVLPGWIQYLVISSHLSDGTELPPAQQMVNVEVPAIP